VAIDSSGAVNFDVSNYHAPEIGTVSSSGDSKANYGTVEVVTVPVTDVDLAIPALSDTVTLTINISEVQTLLDGDQASIGCSMAHVNQTVTDTGADTKDFSVTWDPWYGDANSAEFYGETWCKFTFVITDAQSLTSQVIEFTMAAVGTYHPSSSASASPSLLPCPFPSLLLFPILSSLPLYTPISSLCSPMPNAPKQSMAITIAELHWGFRR